MASWDSSSPKSHRKISAVQGATPRMSEDLRSLKARVRISDFVRQHVEMKREGAEWVGNCPFHNERSGSFKVNDQKQFYKCFGCQAYGDVFDFLQKIAGLSKHEAIDRVRGGAGDILLAPPSAVDFRSVDLDQDMLKRQQEARLIWSASRTIEGTLAERYLRECRMIGLPHLPPSLRFHPALKPQFQKNDTWPAMVAGVTDEEGTVVAIQRTFLAHDGLSKAPIGKFQKMSLGPTRLGAVVLGPFEGTVGISEGVETGLSAMELYRVSSLTVLGSNLDRLVLPGSVNRVVIFADRGEAGEKAAAKAAVAYRRAGKAVAVCFPEIGDDFNDELRARRNGAK